MGWAGEGWPPLVAQTLLLVIMGDYLPINMMDGSLSGCKSKAKQFVLICKSAFLGPVAMWGPAQHNCALQPLLPGFMTLITFLPGTDVYCGGCRASGFLLPFPVLTP